MICLLTLTKGGTMLAFEDILILIRTYQYEQAVLALMEALHISRQEAEKQVLAASGTLTK